MFRRLWGGPPRTEQPADPPAVHRLGSVRTPTLVINGSCDVPRIQEVSSLLAQGIPGARRVDLADTAHLPPLERPDVVTSALRAFLTETA